jgi:cytochrome c nitrite reductase small subunit
LFLCTFSSEQTQRYPLFAEGAVRRSIVITLLASAIIGVAVGLAAYTFIYAKGYSYLTNDPAACANCHVMQAQYDAWMKSSHHSVAACNDCHTPHNIIGKYAVKANNGFWHSFYFTSGHYPTRLKSRNSMTRWWRTLADAVTSRLPRPSTAT